ncbi:uncharacterized protein CTRU02_201502 [Colletotrichum truncatum]|uniref:Uncharacterized protein n=1 Tax=Colletotrichum truncatum TaxID=5467 RepID=A0ACC3ZHJ8_COLTU|nr:uncharacterized protein CTRU02_14373 [Colletotrichum truncatum]KAF6782334.1 hypothetical protein CTRU02_14373 [Colletotrichum truncatum]
MNKATLFTALPPELQHKVLQHLESYHRLTFIQSSRNIEHAVSRNINWLISLLIPSSARNVALATIHAPRRGRREHIRQFRTRVKVFMAEYEAGVYRDRLPNPYLTSAGYQRRFAHPRELSRFRDLLNLLRAIDVLIRDHISKVSRERQKSKDQDDDLCASALCGQSRDAGMHADLGVGVFLARDKYTTRNEKYQTRVHETFFRLELFRRLFYRDPLQPLFSSGDATPVQGPNQVYSLSFRDARIHGFTTRWDNHRRARIWNAEGIRLWKVWEGHWSQRHQVADNDTIAFKRKGEEIVRRIREIRSEGALHLARF